MSCKIHGSVIHIEPHAYKRTCPLCKIADLTEQVNKWESDYDTTLDALNKEIAENKRLKEGLDIYGNHRVGCSFLQNQSVCDCGFDELMTFERPKR